MVKLLFQVFMKNKYEYPVGAIVYVIMQLYYGALLHRLHGFSE